MDGDSSENRSASPGEDSSRSSSKRKRTTKACDICNKRKVKCDGKQPACTQCVNGTLKCTYAREAKKRGPKQGHLKELESRLKQMEALIRPLADKLPDAAAALSGRTDSPSSSTISSAPDPSLISSPHPSGGHNGPNYPQLHSHYPPLNSFRSGPIAPSPQSYQLQPQYNPTAPSPVALHSQGRNTNSHYTGSGQSVEYSSGFAYGSNPNVMPAMANPGLSPSLGFKPAILPSGASPHLSHSEDEDIWNVIDRDFDELMGGDSFAADKQLEENCVNTFTYLLDHGSALPDGAGPGLGNVRQTRSIPKQLRGPFGEVPLAPANEPQYKEWPEEDRIPQSSLDNLLDDFFIYANPILGHHVHEREFRRTLAAQSPLLLNSMYSMAARFSKDPTILKNSDKLYEAGDMFYSKARQLMTQTIDVPSLDTVSALIMLMTYAAGCGRASASWMYSGMAIRMAQSLKLDLDPDFTEVQSLFGSLSWFEKERRRRLWWCCFLMDRYSAAAADRSMLCLDRDVRVFAPVAVDQWQKMSPDDKEPSDDAEGSHSEWQLTILSSTGNTAAAQTPQQSALSNSPFTHYITLGKIFGRVMDYTGMLKSPTPSMPGSQLITVAESEIRRTQLESALREWMAALPSWMRHPGRTFASNWTNKTDDGALSPPPWEVAYLHLFYNTAVVLLHRPKMMACLSQGPAEAVRSAHFLASQQSATAVATMLEIIMAANPELFWITPFVCFCIFQTALVHIIAAQTMRGDDISVSAACQRVKTHLRALRCLSRCWSQGAKLAGILSDLFKSVENLAVLGTSSGAVVQRH